MAVTAHADEVVDLGGAWDFAWTPSSVEETPTPPTAAAFQVQMPVPGKWDDHLAELEGAAWWPDVQFETVMGEVRYLVGTGWHRTSFDAPQAWAGRAVQLTIGKAVGQVHVWLNGRHAGSYDYGVYTPYAIDLTGLVQPGQSNELLISVDNTRGFAGGWEFLGNAGKASGLSRPVTLRVSAGPGRIQDVYVRPGDGLQDLICEVELRVPACTQQAPESRLRWQVTDAGAEKTVARGETVVPPFVERHVVRWQEGIASLIPWCPKRPQLYWLSLEWRAGEDDGVWSACSRRFGLRRFTHEGRRLFLNGSPIYLRGEFGAYYFPVHGTAPNDKAYWVDHILRAKAIGMNYINYAARVCPQELLDAADETGIILQCGDHMTVLQQHRAHYEDVWQPIVRWTRGHPSLGLYGFGGERNYYDGIIEQYQRQHDLIKSLHPECLVMPQQAIRGIDYAFDEQGKQELTPEPFPHHAQRLARYTQACDVFGHYSGGAFGYSYFSTPWQEMDERFRIYDKPISIHEVFMGMSYLDPDNAAKYTGRVPPYLYARLEDDLREAGLFERWGTYHANASRRQGICKKYCLEKVRKSHEAAAFEYLGMTDMHFCEHYTTGLLDEFGELKPGDTIEGILRYNGDSVLLLDFEGGSINRSHYAGAPFEADAMVALYGDVPIEAGTLRWELTEGGSTALEGQTTVANVANGAVTTLHRLALTWPQVERCTRYNLAVHLTAPGYDVTNDWDFWVFPELRPPAVAAAADDKALGLLAGRYAGLRKLADAPEQGLRIVTALGKDDIEHLARGGDVLLLGTAPFLEYAEWTSFRPGLGCREHHNVGHVIAAHPIFKHLPHEGWGDWHFYPVLEGAPCIYFEEELETAFDPILEVISSAEHVRKQAAIFEKTVGDGRLLVCTCVVTPDNPSRTALLDGILDYMTGEAFRPTSALALKALEWLATPADPGDPNNALAAPSFERQVQVEKAWLPYGADYAIDDTVAHTGSRSLKLTITPEDIQKKRDHWTGAQAAAVRFTRRAPEVVQVSAWHKTEGLAEGKGRDFLIFVYINYKGGGRHTLRLPFDPGTHDWQYAETTWKPPKPIAGATLYIGLARKTGTAWIDDVYFGVAPTADALAQAEPAAPWSREPVTLTYESEGLFKIGAGDWTAGAEARVNQEGITKVLFKKSADDPSAAAHEVRIDVSPPVIVLTTQPALAQEGGEYYATKDTAFAFEAADRLSGVAAIEVSVDGGDYAVLGEPLRLPPGSHEVRCRATDVAGNTSGTMTGGVLTGGETVLLRVTVR